MSGSRGVKRNVLQYDANKKQQQQTACRGATVTWRGLYNDYIATFVKQKM